MTPQRIVILGAGGFAREVRWLLSDLHPAAPPFQFAGFVVSDVARLSDHDSRGEVVGGLDWLGSSAGRAVSAIALGIGTPAVRLKLASEIQDRFPWLEWPSLLHRTVELHRSSAHIGRGAILCAGVIGTVNITIADHAVCNLACTLGHESRIGPGSVLNPGVHISGGVQIGAAVLVGTGAQVLQYRSIGDGATVGAGAVVNRDVPSSVTVAGVPAKVLAA